MSVGDETGRPWREGLRGGVGRLQPQLSPVLHESLDQTEQPLSSLSTGVDCSETRQVIWPQYYRTYICDI